MAQAAKAANAAAKAATPPLPGFRLGKQQVFLPNHVITMLRKKYLRPHEACFQVPLRFTKFDLRDYLWNLYKVEIKTVRSFVKEQPLTRRSEFSNAWYRPQPRKIMMVELVKPFQWPDPPTDLQPWSNELWEMRETQLEQQREQQLDAQQSRIPYKSQKPLTRERKELASLAKKMLSGEVKWSNDVILDPRWDSLLAKSAKVKAVPADRVDKEGSKEETVTV